MADSHTPGCRPRLHTERVGGDPCRATKAATHSWASRIIIGALIPQMGHAAPRRRQRHRRHPKARLLPLAPAIHTLLVIDELGYLPLPAEAASALFQVVSQRYLKTSIVITTNRGVGTWGDILGDTTVAAAMLDRLLHRSVVINLDGESYRLRDHHAAADTLRPATTGTRQPIH